VLIGVRGVVRRRRRLVRHWLMPFRSDEADPEAVRRLLETWHQQLLERWWRRPVLGQRGVALEIVAEPDGQGGLEGRLIVAAPPELMTGLEGSLRACYPDGRLIDRDVAPGGVAEVVRLKKRFGFIQALRTPDDHDGRNVVDAVLGQMAALGAPAVVQLAIVPTPAFFDRRSRRLFRARERSAERGRATNPAQPGLRSQVLGRELEGGLAVQHRPLFFVDVRVGAPTYRACQAIAGTLRGESGAENRLVERHMRPWGRGPLYRARLRDAVANPLPSWRLGVLSSSELAALWHLPSPGLKPVALRRSSVPRAPAAPDVSRDPRHALARDERDIVGIRPEDKSDGLGLIGGQKTGKTSVLCQTVRVDAADDECAVIVLMPKPGDARKALSMVPAHRTVHYLDFECPEFGINPLLAEGDAGMVADKIVGAFRDVNEEGDIKGSSDRFLRQAAQAAIAASRAGALDAPPNLWDMYRMLLPSETAFRDHVVGAIYGDPRFTDTATFFGRDLPSDLRDALVNTTSKLDAPRNKILRLMVESLDKVLRHPVQLSIDDVIRKREVLIVDGKMGTFGSDNCRVMMQFILSMLYGAMQRQQQLPEEQRSRVALKVDEAHLVVNDSFADALATLRSAGLEVVAAWQYGEQIVEPKLRAGMMSLLRQRCMFSMGESKDAREMTDIAMSVYVDMIRDDPESRARMRMTPDVIFNLPNHRTLCSWISKGARSPAFVAETIPLVTDEAIVAHHLEAQAARGGFVPDRLPNPLPPFGEDAAAAVPVGVELVGVAPSNGGPPDGNGNGALDEHAVAAFDPSAQSVERPNDRATRVARPAPESYTELDLDDVRAIAWDNLTVLAPDSRHEPTRRELEVMAALWRYRFLFAGQIRRRWWSDSTLRACQQGLTRMAKAGWVRRFQFTTSESGARQRVYCLTRDGFDVGRAHVGARGPYIDPDADWREPPAGDPRAILRDLHVNGWVMALQALAPKAVRSWRGAAESRLRAPRRRERGEWVELKPSDVPVGGNRQLRDVALDRLPPVAPAATVELRIEVPQAPVRFDLLVELDRARGAGYNEEKFRRYDLLVAGWFRMLNRYQTLGVPPVVVFVCEDERQAETYVRTADKVVTARLAEAGTPEAEWPCPGRRQLFFVCERDVHMGSLTALALPELPRELRMKLHGPKAGACHARRVQLIDRALLGLAEEVPVG
ncbi:MAG: hypothetical protein ACR2L8_06520, partial [Solirubrobacteraceae bacterium]